MMMRFTLGIVAIVIMAGIGRAAAPPLRSDLTGIHAVVEKVVFEPSETAPERVQIWGAFLMAGRSAERPVQRGYLYLGLPPLVLECSSCSPPSQATQNARREWADLKAVAGTGQGVAFGARFFLGRVRTASEKPESPDPYPVFMGIFKLGTNPDVDRLNAALRSR